ncbi:DUF2953 domain-containing protein [Bacillus songklensis]|uniref:DUF2953 domain-containing protein n=1 Tax=Bacillus songklensis TaxID=1069116 RepID=A0ABV8AZ43_9BACI
MLWVWLLAAAFCLFVFIILISKLKIKLNLNHSQDNDFHQIKFSLWFGLIRYTYKIPVAKVDKDSSTLVVKEEQQQGSRQKGRGEENQWKDYSIQDAMDAIQNAKELLKQVVGLQKIMKQFFSHISVERIRWNTMIGIGDAMYTGVAVGMAWSLKGLIISLISRYMRLKDPPIMQVIPSFQSPVSETRFQCMISFRIGHAIVTSLRILKRWKRFRKKRDQRLENVQSDKIHSVKM